ncbi:hypothetical protein EHI47_08830 [Rhizobium leguminosarum]|uniref:Uncharacterized protein n=2 Tax=Rhizobium TaxID=379 RepID=A0A444I772_RHILE|nr:hypothetical protein [Rhizobium leguminosarum bv. viciae]RWX06386.1 hypothetical protein EHI45_27600 [Rhizobium leguminosarum]TBE62044.1 hypothetical protein ELH03_24040 [Rhizobium beringeri]RWX34078.1 hypothetical protein EHI47_08830 [Rhizobium leguminosarum]TAU38131.1 hypothetical protein ELI43_32820 [Rhizobium leguminosarum]
MSAAGTPFHELAAASLPAHRPEIGIYFRKARCLGSKSWSVLCASERTHGALGGKHVTSTVDT